ncbi:MAG: HAD-IA family hydrolase [Pseudomonadota bacterium]|nr:phosphoglycolate phosphatase [Pseudomonadales bacterium]MDY6920686.1 HAD-IA family hydrolase [Pseudomonadota bacterium]
MAVPQPIAAVLFDLDGTLIDTAPDFVRVLNQLRQARGLTTFAPDRIRQQVSNGARALVTLAFGAESDNPHFARDLEQLLDAYEQQLAVESRVFPGLEPALEILEQRRIPWGIVTNKPSRFTLPLIAGLALQDRCAVAVCPDQVKQRKPHPEALFKACDLLQVDPAQTLYVGDHARDIEAGRRAGNYTVAADWGYLDAGDDSRLWQADTIMPTPQAFQRWLLDHLH